MKIQLVDVDSSIPNIALMKISTYHKQIGDEIILTRLLRDYYPTRKRSIIDTTRHDITYVSCIFTTNKNSIDIFGNGNIIYGGTGINIDDKLPIYIDNCELDYSIYPECDYSIGFISRGCFRKCSFCFVPKKEGGLRQVACVKDIVKHKKVMFLDNNFLGLSNHKEILRELASLNIRFNFKQGLDIRIIDEETMNLISKSNIYGDITFAYDLIENKHIIEQNLILMASKVKAWRMKVFIYIHPDNKIEDIKHRIEFCVSNKILPYVMRDISCFEDKRSNFYVDLASWCNQVFAIKKLNFFQYLVRRHPNNNNRINNSINIYNEVI